MMDKKAPETVENPAELAIEVPPRQRERMEAESEAEPGRVINDSLYRAVVDTAVDAIIVIDECEIVLSINPAVERIFGWAAAEVVGRNLNMLMPEPYHSEHRGYLERYLRTGE